MDQALTIKALERKLHVLYALVEGNDVALRDFKKEVRDDKRFELLFSESEKTKNSCDKNTQDIQRLQETMVR